MNMSREQVAILLDTPHAAHVVCTVRGVVTREVIEISNGDWNPQSMEYLSIQGARLAEQGFSYTVTSNHAERFARHVFRRIDHT